MMIDDDDDDDDDLKKIDGLIVIDSTKKSYVKWACVCTYFFPSRSHFGA
jgi:hypothetical protein